jgi:hypothetical protein
VLTQEPDEAEREITQLARQRGWKLAAWDVAAGLRVLSEGAFRGDAMPGDPLAVLRAVPTLADREGTALVLLHNFHRYLGNPEVVQTAFAQLVAGKQQRTFLVVLAPVVQIPIELEKLFVVIEHPLPGREQLERIARELTSDSPEDMPTGENLQRVLDAAAGLTRYEAEGSFALSLTRHNALRPESVWELKAQVLKKKSTLRDRTGVRGATLLTQKGYRSTKHDAVLPSTVRLVRLRHRLLRKRSQSHPRRVSGHLTVPQVARAAGLTPHWVYDRIYNGTIEVARDPDTNLYLFPDKPRTIALFKQLRAGKLKKLRFLGGYQDA